MAKKEYSKYFAPNMIEARKRMKRNVNNIKYELEDKYIGLGNGKKYMVKTYGCQGNIADSEKICGIMDSLGFTQVFSEEESDIIFFNTCAIRENAEIESMVN